MAAPLSILVVTNIYPTATRPTLGVFVEQQVRGLRAIGVHVEVFYVDRTERGMSAYYRMLGPLRAAIRKHRPTLLHLMYGGVLADRVTRWIIGFPAVVTFHGSDLLGENLSGVWRRWVSRYGVACSRRAARRAHGVVVVSQRLKPALPANLDAAKVRVIPCGIDLERFRPMDQAACRRKLGWNARAVHVLFASNTGDPVKRPWLASAAVERLNSLGVNADLHYMQGIPNAEVPVWMNASDSLLLTSAHEGSPTVIKEALACRLPVVSVDAGDVAERIEGIAGCHIALPQAEDLAAKLMSVVKAGRRLEVGDKVEELSLGKIALRLERFYGETLVRANHTVGSWDAPERASATTGGIAP